MSQMSQISTPGQRVIRTNGHDAIPFLLLYQFPGTNSRATRTARIMFPKSEIFSVLRTLPPGSPTVEKVVLRFAQRKLRNSKLSCECSCMTFEKDRFLQLFQMVAPNCLAEPAKEVNNDIKHITEGATLQVLYKFVCVQTDDPVKPMMHTLIEKQRVHVSKVIDDSFVIEFREPKDGKLISVTIFFLNAHIFGLPSACAKNVCAMYEGRIEKLMTDQIEAADTELHKQVQDMLKQRTESLNNLKKEVQREMQKMFTQIQSKYVEQSNAWDDVRKMNKQLMEDKQALKQEVEKLKQQQECPINSETEEHARKRVKYDESSNGGCAKSDEAWSEVQDLASKS